MSQISLRTVIFWVRGCIQPWYSKFATEWFGSIAGVTGAALLAVNMPWSGYGWLLFLASNTAWILYAFMERVSSMFLMQLVFTGTSLIGVFRWLV